MLVKWLRGTYSVVVGNDDGEIRVWHPTGEQPKLTFTSFSCIYNQTEQELRERWRLDFDSEQELQSSIKDELLCNMFNDYQVARDTD